MYTRLSTYIVTTKDRELSNRASKEIGQIMISMIIFLSCLTIIMTSSADGIELEHARRNVLGGYAPMEDLRDPRLLAAAKFAMQRLPEESPSYSFATDIFSENDEEMNTIVLKASRQVVAGMNYRMTIGVMKASGDCVGAFKCTVYDRFGDLSVTDWGVEVPCEEVTAMLKEKRPQKPGPETRS